MTSNDDTMQYLMIGEIQKLYGEIKNSDYLLISTHNCHFYLNVRPYNKIDLYEKYNIIHLNSDGKLTNIKRIATDKEDFKTNYELLWKELVFLYNNDVPDLMLNPCRRICETYIKFTKSDLNGFYKDHPGARKLFNVNQHSLDDLEAEQNGKNREEIKNILLGLFKSAKAEDHFNGYWEKSETL